MYFLFLSVKQFIVYLICTIVETQGSGDDPTVTWLVYEDRRARPLSTISTCRGFVLVMILSLLLMIQFRVTVSPPDPGLDICETSPQNKLSYIFIRECRFQKVRPIYILFIFVILQQLENFEILAEARISKSTSSILKTPAIFFSKALLFVQ